MFPEKKFLTLFQSNKSEINNILEKGLEQEINLFWGSSSDILDAETLLAIIRGRGYILGGPRTSDNIGITILPFYHPQIFNSYIETPPNLREKRKLELQTLSLLKPELIGTKSTSLKWYKRLQLARLGLKIMQIAEGIFKRKIIPTYSSVPYFEWMRENKEYRDLIEDIVFNDSSLLWSILDKNSTQLFFRRFFERKNHDHKFLIHILDLEIILRLFYSLKIDKKSIKIVSEILNKEWNLPINKSIIDQSKKLTSPSVTL